jgi:hypothetical protein
METSTINPESQRNVFEVQYFCSTKYTCRQQQLANHYAWDGDPDAQPCGICDNCISCTRDDVQQLPDATDDVCEMVTVIRSLTTHYYNVTPKDAIDVFMHAKTKDIESKGYLASEAYQRTYIWKALKTKELASLALDRLIADGLVRKDCVLKRQK